MTFLLLRVLCTVAFSHLLRLSQARTARPLAAAAINYLVAAVLCAAWAAAARGGGSGAALLLGVGAGLTYVVSLVLMLPAMRESGVAVTGAVLQLSLMAPVAVAALRFGEYPGPLQTVGIGLTLAALPLLSLSAAADGTAGRPRIRPVTLMLFASTGTSQVVMKEFSALGRPRDLPLFSTALFAAATLFTLLWMRGTGDTGRVGPAPGPGKGWAAGEWSMGLLLGGVNTLQLVFLLLALRELPAFVVFPVSAALGIVVNLLASLSLWGERPRPAGWLGLALAVAAVILLYSG